MIALFGAFRSRSFFVHAHIFRSCGSRQTEPANREIPSFFNFALRTLECEPINYEQREREPERLFAQSSSEKHAGMGA